MEEDIRGPDVFKFFLYLLNKEKEEFTVSEEEMKLNYNKIIETLNTTNTINTT